MSWCWWNLDCLPHEPVNNMRILIHYFRMHTVEEKLDHESHIYKYLLTIEPTEMSDAAEYTCRVGTRSTSAELIVDEGRSCALNGVTITHLRLYPLCMHEMHYSSNFLFQLMIELFFYFSSIPSVASLIYSSLQFTCFRHNIRIIIMTQLTVKQTF